MASSRRRPRARLGAATAVLALALAALAGVAACGGSPGTAPAQAARTDRPSDPRAAGAAARELSYLGRLPAQGKLLTGYWVGWSNFGTFPGDQDMARLSQATGRHPGLAACDYNGFGHADAASYAGTSDCDAYLEGYAARGGLAEVGYHPNNPAGGKYATGLTSGQVTALETPGTPASTAWHRQLDAVAAGLSQLGAHGVPVIFRPLMEMNQTGRSTFWWNGGGWTAAAYVTLWRGMYQAITARLTSHDVLWDWSPDQAGNARPAAYYPGSDYVDVTGLDVYASPARDYPAAPVTDYAQVVKPGKPFGFNEIGKTAGLRYSFAAWPAAIRRDYPRAGFFLSWSEANGPLAPGSSGAPALMNAPGNVVLPQPGPTSHK